MRPYWIIISGDCVCSRASKKEIKHAQKLISKQKRNNYLYIGKVYKNGDIFIPSNEIDKR